MNDVHFSKQSDNWETPQYLFDKLDSEFHFNLDVAASHENAKCRMYYTEEDEGLKRSWAGKTIFCNPPYSNVAMWITRARYAADTEYATVVMLIPARTDTLAWHMHIFNNPQAEIRFLQGRIVFCLNSKPVLDKKGNPQNAPFPSAIVIFRPEKKNNG